jgi:hypothetical protein
MTQRFLNPLSKFTTDTLQSLPYATLSFFVTASSTTKAVYADKAKVTSLGVVVTADSAGNFPEIWLDGTYRATLKSRSANLADSPATGTTQTGWPIDTVGDDALTAASIAVTGAITGASVAVTGAATAATSTTTGATTGDTLVATTSVTSATVVASGAITGASVAVTGAATSASAAVTGAITAATVATTGSILSSGSTGIGYSTGAGGAVIQATSKVTAFTLSKVCGTIEFAADALGADTTTAGATWTNTTIAATDLVVFTHRSGGTLGAYNIACTPAAGSATIYIRNLSPGSLSEAPIFRFAVIKGVVA